MKKIGLFLFGICFALQMVAQEQNYFTNPVIRGDVPDPSVIRIKIHIMLRVPLRNGRLFIQCLPRRIW